MAKPFQKQKAKTAKETGNYTFTNFSEGLYQLETPRGLPEQLAKLLSELRKIAKVVLLYLFCACLEIFTTIHLMTD
mgnify:CR=1 FL=1